MKAIAQLLSRKLTYRKKDTPIKRHLGGTHSYGEDSIRRLKMRPEKMSPSWACRAKKRARCLYFPCLRRDSSSSSWRVVWVSAFLAWLSLRKRETPGLSRQIIFLSRIETTRLTTLAAAKTTEKDHQKFTRNRFLSFFGPCGPISRSPDAFGSV